MTPLNPNQPVSFNPLGSMIKDREAIDAKRMFGGADLSQDIQRRYGVNASGLKPAEVARQQVSGYGKERATNMAGDGSEVFWDGRSWNRVGGSKPVPSPAPATTGAMSLQAAPQAASPAQPQTVDANYRTPLISRMEQLANPFDANYQNRMASQGISNAERQYSQAADRTRSMLASRGLMSGGGTGLEAALMAQAGMETAGARERALTGAALDTATRGADFEFRRAGAIDAYNRGLMSDAQALSLLPSQVSVAQSQARGAKIDADLAERTVGDRERMSGSQADLAQAQVDQARLTNDISKMDYNTRQQMQEGILKKAQNELTLSDAEVEAARRFMNETDPKQWWNWSGWKAGKGLMDFLKTGSEIYRNVKQGGV